MFIDSSICVSMIFSKFWKIFVLFAIWMTSRLHTLFSYDIRIIYLRTFALLSARHLFGSRAHGKFRLENFDWKNGNTWVFNIFIPAHADNNFKYTVFYLLRFYMRLSIKSSLTTTRWWLNNITCNNLPGKMCLKHMYRPRFHANGLLLLLHKTILMQNIFLLFT